MTRWQAVAASVLMLATIAAVVGAAPPADRSSLRVGPISIVVTDIFDARELAGSKGLLNFVQRGMNTVHAATKRYVIRRELLFKEGDLFTADDVAETERNLRALGYLTDVSIVPTDTLPGGVVPLEVRVRETWSLNTQFSFSRSSSSSRWTALISDRNFLGHGVKVLAGIGRDEDRRWQQLRYQDRRFLGRSLHLNLATIDLSDGFIHEASFSRPFYAERDAWSFEISGWRQRFEPRHYLDPGLMAGVADAAPRLYVQPAEHREGWRAAWIRRVGGESRGRVWRLGIGVMNERVGWSSTGDLELSTGGHASLEQLRSVSPSLVRDQGRLVQAFLRLETLGGRWATDRYVMRYGPEEDVRLDPWLLLQAGPALASLGTDRQRFVYEVVGQDWSRLGGGWLFTQGRSSGAFGGDDRSWQRSGLVLGWLAHHGGGMTRLWGEGLVAVAPPGTQVPVLGLTRGLRTLENDGMSGDRLLRWNAEHARLIPGELLGFFKLGFAGFYAGGSAWWDGGERSLGDARHELGVGLRFGSTRSASAELGRLDLAWPLDGSGGPKLTAVTGGLF